MFKSQAELDEALRVGTVPAELAVVTGGAESPAAQASESSDEIAELQKLEQAVMPEAPAAEPEKPGLMAKLFGKK